MTAFTTKTSVTGSRTWKGSNISDAPTGRSFLSITLGSEGQLVKTLDYLAAVGKYELAAPLLQTAGRMFEHSSSVARARRLIYLKLMEKHQNTDPFKFVMCSEQAAEQTQLMAQAK